MSARDLGCDGALADSSRFSSLKKTHNVTHHPVAGLGFSGFGHKASLLLHKKQPGLLSAVSNARVRKRES